MGESDLAIKPRQNILAEKRASRLVFREVSSFLRALSYRGFVARTSEEELPYPISGALVGKNISLNDYNMFLKLEYVTDDRLKLNSEFNFKTTSKPIDIYSNLSVLDHIARNVNMGVDANCVASGGTTKVNLRINGIYDPSNSHEVITFIRTAQGLSSLI